MYNLIVDIGIGIPWRIKVRIFSSQRPGVLHDHMTALTISMSSR